MSDVSHMHVTIGDPETVRQGLAHLDYAYIIDGTKCRKYKALFKEFAKQLQFPDSFTHSWAALGECINDLDWLSHDAIIICLTDTGAVLNKEKNGFAVFIEVLRRAAVSRSAEKRGKPSLPFHVIFHFREQSTRIQEIEQIIDARLHNMVFEPQG